MVLAIQEQPSIPLVYVNSDGSIPIPSTPCVVVAEVCGGEGGVKEKLTNL